MIDYLDDIKSIGTEIRYKYGAIRFTSDKEFGIDDSKKYTRERLIRLILSTYYKGRSSSPRLYGFYERNYLDGIRNAALRNGNLNKKGSVGDNVRT